ncbi:MAG: hypothetical protein WCT31_02010 [Candidatus Micrarchaeia archaeon]
MVLLIVKDAAKRRPTILPGTREVWTGVGPIWGSPNSKPAQDTLPSKLDDLLSTMGNGRGRVSDARADFAALSLDLRPERSQKPDSVH